MSALPEPNRSAPAELPIHGAGFSLCNGMKGKALFRLKVTAVFAAGAWAFASVSHGGWLWDDDTYVTANRFLRTGAGLANLWFHPAGLVNYFPLKDTITWVQWHLWGDRPLGYHLTNLALHLISAFLLWRLVDRLGCAWGWLAGLLFCVHPLAVESVAWVSELKNTASLPPLLLSILAYIEYDRGGRRGWYFGSLLWFLAAMLCKSTVAMFPVVLLLYAWWKHGRIGLRAIRASLPFFAISLVLGLVEIRFEHERSMLGFDQSPAHGPWARLCAAGLSLVFYLAKAAFPALLLPTYPRWAIQATGIQFLPWLVLAALALWIWVARFKGRRVALFGLGFFIINLLPVAGFVPMAYQRISWVADHFAYLSLAGLVALAAAGYGAVAPRLRPIALRSVFPAAAVIALAVECRAYAGWFVNRETLWARTLERNPRSWAAYNDLGNLYLWRGQVSLSTLEFSRALELEPDSVGAHNNLAAADVRLGRISEAIAHYEACLRLGADYPEVHYNLGIALDRLGRISGRPSPSTKARSA